MINGARHKQQGWLVAAITYCLLAGSCENDLSAIRDLQQNKLSVDEVTGVVSFFSQSGKMKARLTAPYMLRYSDTLPRVEFPNSLHVDFYGDSLRIESYLDAQKGFYYETRNLVKLTDSVVVIRLNGDTLKTKELYWDQNQHQLYSETDVEIRQKTKTIFGKGFRSDEQLRNFTIDSFKGVVLVEESKFGGN